jgi:hypothetical protein
MDGLRPKMRALWRREGDSNPWHSCECGWFSASCLKPLGHLCRVASLRPLSTAAERSFDSTPTAVIPCVHGAHSASGKVAPVASADQSGINKRGFGHLRGEEPVEPATLPNPALPIERKLLYPVKSSPDQQEVVAVGQLKLHVDLMVVHAPVHNEPVLHRALESQVGFPVPVSAFAEDQSFLRRVDGRAIESERIVHALESHLLGKIEDGAPPARVVSKKRRACLAVNGHLRHLPDAIKR